MDLRQLRYFVAVAEERHFGRAAERLHMAQPPLSQQIKQIEAELGVQLLERTTRKVDLTDAGRLLLDRARQLLADADDLIQDVREVGQGVAGVLRVGFAGSATYRLMPSIVRLARTELPGVRLHVVGELLTPRMEQALLENRLDVAVLRPPVESTELTLDEVAEDRLLVAIPNAHPLAAESGPLELERLAGEDQVGYPRRSAVSSIVWEACRRAGFRPRIVQEATETSTLLAFVASSMGVALVPDGARPATAARVTYRALADAPAVGLSLAWKAGAKSPLIPAFQSIAHRAAEQVRQDLLASPLAPVEGAPATPDLSDPSDPSDPSSHPETL